MSYDDWKTQPPRLDDEDRLELDEWPGLDVCPDCGFFLLPDELPHGGACGPERS
jgi:hypothetical protein